MKLRDFYKVEAGGNDFIIVLNMNEEIPEDKQVQIAEKLCSRRTAVGADGLIILSPSNDAEIKMIYYNADGSRAALCAGGMRAVGILAVYIKLSPKTIRLETDSGIYNIEVTGDNSVRNSFFPPKILNGDHTIKDKNDNFLIGDFINVGVPYFCIRVNSIDDLNNININEVGRHIRNHPFFDPEGTNVTFYYPVNNHEIRIRIYERGVEGETLSSGTGAYSSAIGAALNDLVKSPVRVISPGGTVTIGFKRSNNDFSDTWLEGVARIVYHGELISTAGFN